MPPLATDVPLDWLTGSLAGTTFLLAVATFLMVRTTVRAARASEAEAKATAQLVIETRSDRALGIQPFLVTEGSATLNPEMHGVTLRNIGAGPALRIVVWEWAHGVIYRSDRCVLATGEAMGMGSYVVLPKVGTAGTSGDPGRHIVGESSVTNLVGYCVDQLGNRLRFNLRSGDPPDLWLRDAPAPDWAPALDGE